MSIIAPSKRIKAGDCVIMFGSKDNAADIFKDKHVYLVILLLHPLSFYNIILLLVYYIVDL